MRIRLVGLLTLAVLGSPGCATTALTVKKVKEGTEPKGIRYSLPKPFLLVTPASSGDGSLKVEVIYLPDETKTYAIDASTKRGKYDLTVNVKDGLLNKIIWSQKDAELAAESLKAGAELVKGELDRRKKEQDDQDAKAAAERKELTAEVKTLQTTFNAAELELRLAVIELEAAQAAVDNGDQSASAHETLQKAQVKREKARASRDFAEEQLQKAKARESADSFNVPQPDKGKALLAVPNAPDKNQSLFWSPVLYEILDNGKGVELKAVSWHFTPPPTPVPTASAREPGQIALLTSTVPKPSPDKPAVPKVLGSTSLSRIWKKGPLRLVVEFDTTLKVRENARTLSKVSPTGLELVTPPPFTAILLPDRKRVRLEFSAPLAPGDYQIEIPFTYSGKDDGVTIRLTVQP